MKRPMLILVSLLTLAVAFGLFHAFFSGGSGEGVNPFVTMGRMAAEETARMVNDSGRVTILVGKRGNPNDPIRAQGPVLTAFRETLKQHHHVTVVPMDPEQPAVGLMGVSTPYFLEFVRGHTDVDAIVSFAGVLSLSDAEVRTLPTPRPKIACFYGSIPSKSLFLSDLVQVAIIPRFGPGSGDGQPKTAREWFDKEYVVVTAKTIDSLPDAH